MVKCPFCGTTHVANTVFCGECGNYLLEDDQRKTDPLEKNEAGWSGEVSDISAEDSSLPEDSQLAALRLKIGERKREVEVRLNKDVNIGRVDPTSTVFPEVDLTNDEDAMKSVSRRHARIFMRNNAVRLEDLGSVNGTLINGRKLDPYMPEVLHDGDKLQLGRVAIEVSLQLQ
jgi:pSer/pThr/pTyr-binding forkhead associated (FHA) protein